MKNRIALLVFFYVCVSPISAHAASCAHVKIGQEIKASGIVKKDHWEVGEGHYADTLELILNQSVCIESVSKPIKSLVLRGFDSQIKSRIGKTISVYGKLDSEDDWHIDVRGIR